MRPIRALGYTALIAAVFAGGCIAAVRKGVGTLRGANGSMTITQDGGDIQPGEMIGAVSVQQNDGVGAPASDFTLVSNAVTSALQEHHLYNASNGDLSVRLNATRYVNRPAKKVLELTATLFRGDHVIATADMSADLNGFGSSEDVAEAIGKATVEFIDHVNGN